MAKPTATADFNTIYANDSDGSVSGNLLANDLDNGGGAVSLKFLDGVRVGPKGTNTVEGEYGTFEIYPDGSYTYTLKPGLTVPAEGLVEKVGYKIANAASETDFDYLTIDIKPANEKPVAVTDNFDVTETHVVTGNVLANDLDENPATLQVARAGSQGLTFVPTDSTLTVEGVYGTLEIGRDGHFTYTLNTSDTDYINLGAGGHAVETFKYRIADEAFDQGPPNSNTTDVDFIHFNITNDSIPLV